MNLKLSGIILAFVILVLVIVWFAIQFKDTLRYLNEDNVKQQELLVSESIYLIFNTRTYYHNEVISMVFEKSELDSIQLLYSTDDGVSWIEIVNNILSKEYEWKIPNTIFSDKVKLRIKSSSALEFTTESFTIMPSITFKTLATYIFYESDTITLELQSTDDEVLAYGEFLVEYSIDNKKTWTIISSPNKWVPTVFGSISVRYRSTRIKIPFEVSGILSSPIIVYRRNIANGAYGNFASLNVDSSTTVFKNKPIQISWTLWDNTQQNISYYVDYLYSGQQIYTNYQTTSSTNADIYNLTTASFSIRIRTDEYNFITSSVPLKIVNQWQFLYDDNTVIASSDGIFYVPIFIQTYGAEFDTSQISLQLMDIYTLALQTITIYSTTVTYDSDSVALVLFKLSNAELGSNFHVIFSAQNQTYITESYFHYDNDGSIENGKYVITRT